MLLWQIILLAVGMIMLIKGADFFVDGSSKIAKALHIPSLIIGLTLVSMGTIFSALFSYCLYIICFKAVK